jgi:hypothetical protein
MKKQLTIKETDTLFRDLYKADNDELKDLLINKIARVLIDYKESDSFKKAFKDIKDYYMFYYSITENLICAMMTFNKIDKIREFAFRFWDEEDLKKDNIPNIFPEGGRILFLMNCIVYQIKDAYFNSIYEVFDIVLEYIINSNDEYNKAEYVQDIFDSLTETSYINDLSDIFSDSYDKKFQIQENLLKHLVQFTKDNVREFYSKEVVNEMEEYLVPDENLK